MSTPAARGWAAVTEVNERGAGTSRGEPRFPAQPGAVAAARVRFDGPAGEEAARTYQAGYAARGWVGGDSDGVIVAACERACQRWQMPPASGGAGIGLGALPFRVPVG